MVNVVAPGHIRADGYTKILNSRDTIIVNVVAPGHLRADGYTKILNSRDTIIVNVVAPGHLRADDYIKILNSRDTIIAMRSLQDILELMGTPRYLAHETQLNGMPLIVYFAQAVLHLLEICIMWI